MTKYLWDWCANFVKRALHSPFGMQTFILGFVVLFLTSFRPPHFLWEPEPFGEEVFSDIPEAPFTISENGFIDNFAGFDTSGLQEVLIEDKEGGLVRKVHPRLLDRAITYTVKSGDNPSKISHKFGIKVSTLLWNNNLTAKSTLKPGQKLTIPPTDGIYYSVQLGESLSQIAQIHDIPLSDIYQYNSFKEGDAIQVGQEIFLPQARKIFVQQPLVDTSTGKVFRQQTPQIKSIGFKLKRPTTGTLTQGVRKGHTALDIANKLNTPIYASEDGVVSVSKDGWNYGYGNYMIIDHDNGVQTVYAHLNTRKIDVGQKVQKGQIIGLMGNTGRVAGRTGIHLHYEIRINGRKVNPNHYF